MAFRRMNGIHPFSRSMTHYTGFGRYRLPLDCSFSNALFRQFSSRQQDQLEGLHSQGAQMARRYSLPAHT